MPISIDLSQYQTNSDGSKNSNYPNGDKPGGVSWRQNEPLGLTQIVNEPFDDINVLNAPPWFISSTTGTKSIVADTTGGVSPQNVLQQLYAAGFSGGSGGTATGVDTLNNDEIYVCLRIKWSSNWQAHPTGTNKFMFATIDDFGGGGDPLFMNLNTQGAQPRIIVYLQGAGVGRVLPRVAEANITYGQWYTIEMRFKMNTAYNVADGEAQVWVDGVLSTDLSDVLYYSDAGSAGKWNTVKLDQTWGGSGGTVTNDMTIDHDHMFIGVK